MRKITGDDARRPAKHANSCEAAADLKSPTSLGRREFLGGVTTATIVSSGLCSLTLPETTSAQTPDAKALARRPRNEQAYRVRTDAALYQKNLALREQLTNSDEERYQNKIGSFTKGLPHNRFGEVDPGAYKVLLDCLKTGRHEDFEKIPMAGVKKLVNPAAAIAFTLEGPDPHQLAISAPPSFSSAEQAGEMTELYWQALTRDVPFAEYSTHPLTNAAVADLSKLSDFRGPKVNGEVTAGTLFRGNSPGDLAGPYVSQFLWKDFRYGAIPLTQRIRTPLPDVDYIFTYARWLSVQDGEVTGANQFDASPRYIRNNRDLAEYVHRDFTYQAFLNACLILMDMYAPLDFGNPYKYSRTQAGFSTFGEPHVLDVVARVANCALMASWYQKWLVHRRHRPEEFGGRVHLHMIGKARYPIHPDLLNSRALDAAFSKKGTYLLTQAYSEGCPLHSSYPSGHAAIAGACATVLKAFFHEAQMIRNPVVASPNGLSLEPYKGPDLTVGGELNKLAANISIGRNAAGIHWRTDAQDGLRLGEAVALGIFADMKRCAAEDFGGFSLTTFDGTTITV